ncbi:MAG: hypothetical protein ACI8RN_000592, partial [Glaciecola sp.]
VVVKVSEGVEVMSSVKSFQAGSVYGAIHIKCPGHCRSYGRSHCLS